jgi:hypothetical protein
MSEDDAVVAAAGPVFGPPDRKNPASGRATTAINAACVRYARRQPMEEIRSWASRADAARPNPFADWTMEIASPRRRTNRCESSGTKTTSPRQFAPRVITSP